MTARGHRGPHHICPSFLGHNLEENAEGASEVVEVVVRIRTSSWPKHIPIEWSAVVLADTVVKDICLCIVTRSHSPVEKVQAVDSEGKEQA